MNRCTTCTDIECGDHGKEQNGCTEWTNERLPAAQSKTLYVYVANRMSGDPAQYLCNVGEMARISAALILRGFCPFNPAGDFLDGIMLEEPIPVELYHERSMHLLRLFALAKPHAVMLVLHANHRNGERSVGVAGEIEEARKLGIPIVWSVEELCGLRGSEPNG